MTMNSDRGPRHVAEILAGMDLPGAMLRRLATPTPTESPYERFRAAVEGSKTMRLPKAFIVIDESTEITPATFDFLKNWTPNTPPDG